MSAQSPALAGLQQLFQAHVQSAGQSEAATMRALVAADARAGADARLGVYVEAYRLRLSEALAVDYPCLRALLGVPEFERLCGAYIAAHPSTTPSIRWLGRHLAGFLAEAPDYFKRPVLAEVASFEWQQGEVFDSPDTATIGIERIAAVPPAAWFGMRLLPHPSVRRLALRWNAPELVRAETAKQKRPAPKQSAQPKAWLLWRDAAVLDIHWRSLAADEAAAFDAVLAQRGFGDICERLCKFVDADQAPMQAASLLKRWVVDGLITDLEFAG